MSQEKHAWLLEQGFLNPDGTKAARATCPNCGHSFAPDGFVRVQPGDAVAQPVAIPASSTVTSSRRRG